MLYVCDPEKNTMCMKSRCKFKNKDNECFCTTQIIFANLC